MADRRNPGLETEDSLALKRVKPMTTANFFWIHVTKTKAERNRKGKGRGPNSFALGFIPVKVSELLFLLKEEKENVVLNSQLTRWGILYIILRTIHSNLKRSGWTIPASCCCSSLGDRNMETWLNWDLTPYDKDELIPASEP